MHGGDWLVSSAIRLKAMHTIDQHLTEVRRSLLVPTNGRFVMEFRISTAPVTAPPLKVVVPTRTVAETVMDKIYRDSVYEDVVFVFDQAPASQSTTHESDITLDSVADTDVDFGMSFDYPKEQDVIQEQSTSTQEKQNMIPKTLEVSNAIPGGHRPQPSKAIIRAHRLVLCQWPYFKAMFEGGFAESGPDQKQILIKDVKHSAFQAMLKFMYVGKLPRDIGTMVVCADELVDDQLLSLEDLFLVSHRYDVPELCAQVAAKILSRLDATNCISFLFRSGYMFNELRGPVIKIVVKTCGNQIAKRSIRDSYKDHPDFVDILGELFEQHHMLYNK
ncbi:hypothetical protein BG003_000232 [Podila horticola]|nr:hypothetical protein BG003_000232 [Podila horticola]